jgi:potassium large conductance calcium-activated channel subfamily M alpha protein 1
VTLRWWIEQSRTGQFFEVFHSLLSLASCALYIMQTYQASEPQGIYSLFVLSEIIFVCVFLLDYVLRLVGFGLPYALSRSGLVDVITTFPTLVTLVVDLYQVDALDGTATNASTRTSFLFLRFLRLSIRLLRALRIVRVLRTVRLMRVSLSDASVVDSSTNENVKRQVMEIVLTAVSIIFIAASLLQLLEVDADGLPRFEWHEAFYMTVVTISTVGYGDLAPITVEGRMAIAFIIMMSLVIIPRQTSKLINMATEPVHYGNLPPADARHIVITGNGALSHATVSQFLRALFAVDSFALRSQLPSVVLVHHAKIPQDIRALLDDGRFLDRVSYVRGTALVDVNLLRARVSSAEAVLVLGDPGSDEFVKEDAASVMICLAIRSYCHQVPMLVQLLSTNSLGDLRYTLDPSWPRVQAVNGERRGRALPRGGWGWREAATVQCEHLACAGRGQASRPGARCRERRAAGAAAASRSPAPPASARSRFGSSLRRRPRAHLPSRFHSRTPGPRALPPTHARARAQWSSSKT